MKLNTTTILTVLLLALAAYVWLGKQPLEARGANIIECTNTEPTTFAAFQALNSTRTNSINVSVDWCTDAPTCPASWIKNATIGAHNYSYVRLSMGAWAGNYSEVYNISGMGCNAFMTLYAEGMLTNGTTTFDDITLNDHRVLSITSEGGGAIWCNEADTVMLSSQSEKFVNYTRTYITCTNRTTTSLEDACLATTQPAVWNGTACRCVVTGYALDATVSTATCAAKVKALNEICGGPASETCTTDLKCVIEKDATEGLCQSRTWLDATTDYIKDHAWQSIAIGAGILVIANLVFAKFTLRKGRRRR